MRTLRKFENIRLGAGAFAALLTCTFAFSQARNPITVQVVDATGAAIPGASITTQPGDWSGVTDANGRLRLASQPVVETLSAASPGFRSVKLPMALVATNSGKIVLQIGSFSGPVVVRPEPPELALVLSDTSELFLPQASAAPDATLPLHHRKYRRQKPQQ